MTKPDLSDFDAVAEISGPPKRCTVRLAMENLSPERADSLRAALAQDAYTHAVIARTVTKWGIKMGGYTIGRHRKGECCCRD